MIENDINLHKLQQATIEVSRVPFKCAVVCARAPDAENDVGAAYRRGMKHLINCVWIILKVRVERNEKVARRGQQPRNQRVLMTAVARKLDATEAVCLVPSIG